MSLSLAWRLFLNTLQPLRGSSARLTAAVSPSASPPGALQTLEWLTGGWVNSLPVLRIFAALI